LIDDQLNYGLSIRQLHKIQWWFVLVTSVHIFKPMLLGHVTNTLFKSHSDVAMPACQQASFGDFEKSKEYLFSLKGYCHEFCWTTLLMLNIYQIPVRRKSWLTCATRNNTSACTQIKYQGYTQSVCDETASQKVCVGTKQSRIFRLWQD